MTGVIGRVDLRTGSLELVNAGHVAPYWVRGKDVRTLRLPADFPFGLFSEATFHNTHHVLAPGDRVVFVTDGMLDRNAASMDLIRAIRETMSLHPREAARALADSVLEATGHALSDDATLLCLDWHGRHDLDRETSSGTEPERASEPLA